ncbi:MAG: hypothetical protein MUO31_00910 [Thermodesulfovibrionales bacterium]|nr:hypothetical protein [Thermodesulfovibrionales bacterium]
MNEKTKMEMVPQRDHFKYILDIDEILMELNQINNIIADLLPKTDKESEWLLCLLRQRKRALEFQREVLL